jgi:uncharacterized protein involved in response to NO
MRTAEQSSKSTSRLAIFSQGFRPFFFCAAIWAVIAIAIWVAMLLTGIALPSRFDSLTWHMHEMLFGFVMAATAGFLLTAIPNWTKRLPVSGAPLAGLAGLWLAGRVACLLSALMPIWLAVGLDLAFPVALVAVATREIVAGRNWRNLVILAPVTTLGIANLLMHLEANGLSIAAGLGWRLALVAVVTLITLIGGRIIPSFSRNWLVKENAAVLPEPAGLPDKAALVTLLASLLGWVAFPNSRVIACGILFGAALNLWRLYRWRGISTAKEPLLLILHVGYGWVIIGATLLSLSVFTNAIPETAAIHALTVGAIATMILAVMSRATRGHTGRSLTADSFTRLIFGLITLGALARLWAAFGTDWSTSLLYSSAALWCAAFAAFGIAYGPMLLFSRDDK